MSGRLFIIATPIGNLQDISARTRDVLSDCDVVLVEDTRVSIKLLNHLALSKPLISCHQFNESKRLDKLEQLAKQGASVALLSDAGTPLISDPGHVLVQKAIDLGMEVIPIAGPSAFLLALVGSGLPCDRFVFEGFLPQKTGERRKYLEKLGSESRTLVFYVSPHDQESTLTDMLNAFGERRACLARELTKKYEEFRRGTLKQLLHSIQKEKVRGECVLVVEGGHIAPEIKTSAQTVADELKQALQAGQTLKDVSSKLAKKFGWTKSEVYRLGLQVQSAGNTPADME